MLLKPFFVTALVSLVLLILASSVASSTMAGDANERAAARSRAGMTRELQQLRDNNVLIYRSVAVEVILFGIDAMFLLW